MSKCKFQTLQSLVAHLPSFGNRRAIGLRQELGVRWWGYQRLHHEAFRVAQFFKDRNIQKGECILLQAPNCPEWAAILLGAALRGVIVVPVDDPSSPEFLEFIAKEVNAKLFIFDPGHSCNVLQIPGESIFIKDTAPGKMIDRDLVEKIDANDPALIYYTSGTTSRPRGVIITHQNLISAISPFRNWRWLVRLIPFRLLAMSPLSHIQGLMLGICVPLSVGLSVIYTPYINPQHMIRTIHDNRVTLLVAVPRLQQLLAKALLQNHSRRYGVTLEKKRQTARYWWLRRHYTWREVRPILGYRFWVLLVGGARVPVEDETFWRDTGCFFIHGYGLTETTCLVSVNSPFSRQSGTVGKPLSNLSVRIAADGEVLVQGPTVTPGYYKDDSSNQQAFSDGFFKTGDLVRKDHLNRLYFLGRKKDFIVTSEGHNVHPHEIEEVINRLPGVNDSVVMGIEQEGHEEVHAVLLLETGASAPGIISRTNSQLQPHQRIRSWTIWPYDDFPRARLLKVKRSEIADFIRNTQKNSIPSPSPRDPPPSLEEIKTESDRKKRLQLIARYVIETPPDQFTSEDIRLVDNLGLSSIDMVELMSILEKKCNRVFEYTDIPGDASLSDLQRTSVNPGSDSRASRIPTINQSVKWAENPVVNFFRRIFRPFIIYPWFGLRARLTVKGKEHLADLQPPFIVAGIHHEHAMDVLAIYRSLPGRLCKKLMYVTSRWIFGLYLDPTPEVSYIKRFLVGAVYYLAALTMFQFATISHFDTARSGLLEICRLIDRGYSPIIFLEPGVGMLAQQTRIPILPVILEGNDGIGYYPRLPRNRVTVNFEKPIFIEPHMTEEQINKIIRHLKKKDF